MKRTDTFILILIALASIANIQLYRMHGNLGDVNSLVDVSKALKTQQEEMTTNQTSLEQLMHETKVLLDLDQDIEIYKIKGLQKGYYLITNVFSVHSNTSKWISSLKQKGLKPQVFINPDNGWEYVYVHFSRNPKEVIKKQKELKTREYLKDIRIGEIIN